VFHARYLIAVTVADELFFIGKNVLEIYV